MANHVTGTSTPDSVLLSNLGELRQHVLAAHFGNPLFPEAEQLRVDHFAHESEDIARLRISQHTNVLAEITRRETAAVLRDGQATLQATLRWLSLPRFWNHYPHQSQLTPAWALGLPILNGAECFAGTSYRTVFFTSACSSILANLLTHPRL